MFPGPVLLRADDEGAPSEMGRRLRRASVSARRRGAETLMPGRFTRPVQIKVKRVPTRPWPGGEWSAKARYEHLLKLVELYK